MRKILIAAMIVFTTCSVMLAEKPAKTEINLATVSMERLFDEYHRTRTWNSELKKRATTLEEKRDNLALEARSKQRALETLAEEANDRSLSEAERTSKKREAEEAYKKARSAEEVLIEFDRTEKMRFNESMREAQQELVAEIKAEIRSYSLKHGYTLVLDVSGKTLNSVESLVYSDPGFDITEPILKILNQKGR